MSDDDADQPGPADLELPPGYHFTISFCDVACRRDTLEQIKKKLIDTARDTIREHDLRDADGRYIGTRIRLRRTAPLLDG